MRNGGQRPGGPGRWTRLPAVPVDGRELTVYATGDPGQPAVVLLHGLEDSWSSWDPLVTLLEPHVRCYAVNLPWSAGGDYGWRTRPAEEWTAAALAAVPEPASALIAHSFSANAVIQAIAGGVPVDAGALVLVSPFYRPPTVPVDWNTFDRSLADFRTTMTHGLRIKLGERAAGLEPEIFEAMADVMLKRIGVQGFLAVFEQFTAASGLDLSGHRTPTLIVAGSHDPGIAGERADWLGRAMPHARLAVDPRFSHFCHVEQPEILAPLIAGFLGEARGRTPATDTGVRPARPPQERTATMPTLAGASSGYTGRPRYEGANISTFIGFKNFMTLAEDAVLHHFREHGHGPQRLFERHGLGLTLVSSSARLTATMHSDDLVTGTVTALPAKKAPGASFDVRLVTQRGDETVRLLNARLRVQLVAEKDGAATEPVPAELAGLVVGEVTDTPGAESADLADVTGTDRIAAALAERSGNGFLWSSQIPYFSCHAYTRIQHSAYVKLLEEAVDRYLDHAGLPITGLLAQRDWIPVVSRARVDLHADAAMGETLLITFAVDDVIKDTVFTARMECHVLRGDRLVRTASATIMHGYVLARGPQAFQDLVVLDAPTQNALLTGSH